MNEVNSRNDFSRIRKTRLRYSNSSSPVQIVELCLNNGVESRRTKVRPVKNIGQDGVELVAGYEQLS